MDYGIIGVYLNINEGVLKFSLNDELINDGFCNQLLMNQPVYPAVSLIHDVECKL